MTRLRFLAQTVLTWLQRGEAIVCAVGLVATTLLIFAQVINRYWLHFEIMIFGDLALYCFIFFMFVAGALATWNENHVSVDVLRDRLLSGRPHAHAIHRVAVGLLSIVILCTFLPQSHSFLLRSLQYPEYGTLVHWFNTSWLMATFSTAMILVLVHLIVIAVRDTRALMQMKDTKDGGQS